MAATHYEWTAAPISAPAGKAELADLADQCRSQIEPMWTACFYRIACVFGRM